jgi:Carboxypeptidase regulatory-like domain
VLDCVRRVPVRAGLLVLALCLIAGNSRLLARQTVTATTGAVNGVVTDSTRALVPGVTVRLSGPSLMTARTTITDENGAYRFSAVPTGDQSLTFELAGFATLVREGIHVGVGFTATVNAELSPGTISDSLTVRGSPVVDLTSTTVTTHFDSEKLASLPGARDSWAVLANTPGIAMSKMDVGGNGALAQQEYTAYGLRPTTGVNRNEVEGIRVGGAVAVARAARPVSATLRDPGARSRQADG